MWQFIDEDRQRLKFSIWTPVAKAVTATDEDRVLHGIASTGRKDQQGETILQKGIETGHLLGPRGIINWHHQSKTDPGAIIGKPQDAFLNNENNLYVVGRLFPATAEIEKANHAWKLACHLDEHPEDGSLGWSVEGQALRKGNLVVKSILRALALTYDPVQADSWASVMKAMTEGIDDLEIIDFGKAATNDSHEALRLEMLDSNQKGELLKQLFFGKVPIPTLVLTKAGKFKQGLAGLHAQLTLQGVHPGEAKDILLEMCTKLGIDPGSFGRKQKAA